MWVLLVLQFTLTLSHISRLQSGPRLLRKLCAELQSLTWLPDQPWWLQKWWYHDGLWWHCWMLLSLLRKCRWCKMVLAQHRRRRLQRTSRKHALAEDADQCYQEWGETGNRRNGRGGIGLARIGKIPWDQDIFHYVASFPVLLNLVVLVIIT